jgi:hypothetical protein
MTGPFGVFFEANVRTNLSLPSINGKDQEKGKAVVALAGCTSRRYLIKSAFCDAGKI